MDEAELEDPRRLVLFEPAAHDLHAYFPRILLTTLSNIETIHEVITQMNMSQSSNISFIINAVSI